jgi:hypothetical protein
LQLFSASRSEQKDFRERRQRQYFTCHMVHMVPHGVTRIHVVTGHRRTLHDVNLACPHLYAAAINQLVPMITEGPWQETRCPGWDTSKGSWPVCSKLQAYSWGKEEKLKWSQHSRER